MTTKTKAPKTKAPTTTIEAPILSPIALRIAELVESKIGSNVAKIRATLTLEDHKPKDIDLAIKEAGLSKAKPDGFTYTDTLSYLEELPRTELEFFTKVLEEGTKNEARWINDRNKIRATLNAVHIKYGAEFVEIAATKELKDKLKLKAKG